MTFLTSFAAWLVKTIGITGCALLALWTYEEGMPFADRLVIPASIPLVGGFGIGNIPVIGQLTVGHVQSYAADQVKLATAELVSKAQVTAAQATSLELRRQLNAASQALTENEKRQAADEMAAQAQDAQSAIEVADYEKKLAAANRQCNLDGADLQFLQSH